MFSKIEKKLQFIIAGSLVLAMGEAVKTIPGERTNIKVTYEDDIRMAEAILTMQERG